MPGYNAYRKACGLRQLTSWRQRPTEVDKKYWDKLKDVYNTVDDIDLYVGGVGETSVRGGVVGPTFACLIADQVRNKKYLYLHMHMVLVIRVHSIWIFPSAKPLI